MRVNQDILKTDKKIKVPIVLGKSKKKYTIEDIDMGMEDIEVGKIAQYNVLEEVPGLVVGGVGIDRPPRAHLTYRWKLREAYFGIIDSIEEVTKRYTDEGKKRTDTTEKINMRSFKDRHGIMIKEDRNAVRKGYEKEYSLWVVKFDIDIYFHPETNEVIRFQEQKHDGVWIGEFRKPSMKTLKNIFEVLSPSHLEELGIETKEVTKYLAPDGTEVYMED